MRAAPALGVTVPRSPHWCAALALLATLVTASTAAWALQRGGDALGVLALLGVLLLGSVLLWRAWRRPRWHLRWDGQAWWLAAPGAEPRAGELRLSLDLGAWLLLQFRAAPGGPRLGRRVWLPLQRRGSPADWHALRCALYSPRPAADPPRATDPSA
jgi:hypothetical protein